MAFKTKAQLFGDDAGNGPQVPVDETNPSGHNASVRGYGFGEALTSAILNRLGFALADNTDDLNTRVAAVEGLTLDDVYNEGHSVTKDAGALTSVSALATAYGDDPANAHWRANAKGDSIGGGVGFDFLADRSGGSGLSGSEAALGFLDRRGFAISGYTVVHLADTAELFVASDSDRIRLTAGGHRWKDGSNRSDIILGLDMIEVSGSATATANGLYLISALESTATDISVVNLDGSAVVFPTASEAVTITVYRPRLASWGGWSNRTGLRGTVISGAGESVGTTLDLIPGSPSYSAPSGGAPTALRVFRHNGLGVLQNTFLIDNYGRLVSNVNQDQIGAEDQKTAGGSAAFAINKSLAPAFAGEIGVLVTSANNNATGRHDFLSLRPITGPAGLGFSATVACTLSGAGTANVDASLAGSAWAKFLNPGGVVVEVITPTECAGYYMLYLTQTSPSRVVVKTLGGLDPSVWTAGAGSIRFHSIVSAGLNYEDGRDHILTMSLNYPDAEEGISIYTPNPYIDEAGASSVSALRSAIVVRHPDSVTPTTVRTAFSVRSDGNVVSRGTYDYGDATTRSYSKIIPISKGLGQFNPTQLWDFEIVAWESNNDSAVLAFPLELPQDAVLTAYEILVDPGAAGRAGANRMTSKIVQRDIDAGISGLTTPSASDVANSSDDDGGSDSFQILGVDGTINAGAGLTIDNTTYEYYLYVSSGTPHSNDRVRGVRITFLDPGPRNH